MSEYKWLKEMTAWAQGKQVQYRPVYQSTGRPAGPWRLLDRYRNDWNIGEEDEQEYRVYELEIGSYYKLRFRDPELTPVVAVFLGGTRLRWMGHGGSVVDTTVDSATLCEIKPEDKVF